MSSRLNIKAAACLHGHVAKLKIDSCFFFCYNETLKRLMMKIVTSTDLLAGVRAYGGRQGVPASNVAMVFKNLK